MEEQISLADCLLISEKAPFWRGIGFRETKSSNFISGNIVIGDFYFKIQEQLN